MGWSAPDNHQSLFTGDWRLSWFPGLDGGELYDLRHDPHELVNLYHDPRYRTVRDDQLELQRQYARTDEPTLAPISRY